MSGTKEMIPQNDLRAPGGQHAALMAWMVRDLAMATCSQLNSAGFLLQEWLGVPTTFIFPMISGTPRNGNLEQLTTGPMLANLVLDLQPGANPTLMVPGRHTGRVLEKHQDFLQEHQPALRLTADIMCRLEPGEQYGMNALIWMILRVPGYRPKDLEENMVGLWRNLQGDPHERFRNACASLSRAADMARDQGVKPRAALPSQRENPVREDPDQRPETCRTHGEPYGLESEGHRFHLVKLNGIYWSCWDHATTLTAVSIGPAPRAKAPWSTGAPEA